MTINKAMNIALSGLNSSQKALNVVSHNIANMNTEGYAKQRVNFSEVRVNVRGNTVADQIASLSGVTISSITTASCDYKNNYYRTQNAISEGLDTHASIATQLSDLLDAMKDTGLTDSLTAFFDSANALSQNPTDMSLRINFAEKAKATAEQFNSMYTSIDNLKTSVIGDGTLESAQVSQAGTYVDQLNTKMEELTKVNIQIKSDKTNASLQSQRDQLLKDITGIVGGTTTINDDGTASVSIGDYKLVSSCEIANTPSIHADGTIWLTDTKTGKENDVTSDITDGTLGGALASVPEIEASLDDLNTLAKAFADEMNEIQTYVDGDTKACAYDRVNDQLVVATEDLFTTSDGSGTITAANIKINDAIYNDPDKIAAARVDTSETGWEKSVGNGDNALAFYNSQSEKLADLGGLTITDYITSMSTKAGLNAESLTNQASTQADIVDGLYNQILSETGVNLDEELTNMITYQQAYNASARVFSCCVEVMDTLVSLGT